MFLNFPSRIILPLFFDESLAESPQQGAANDIRSLKTFIDCFCLLPGNLAFRISSSFGIISCMNSSFDISAETVESFEIADASNIFNVLFIFFQFNWNKQIITIIIFKMVNIFFKCVPKFISLICKMVSLPCSFTSITARSYISFTYF